MTPEPPPTRRTVLRAGTAATGGACALALAGCSGGSVGAAKGSVPQAIPAMGTPVRVGRLSDVPVGATAVGQAEDKSVVVYRPDATTVLAYSDVCTHAGCRVAPAGADFKCPCHGSVFKGADGTVVSGPAKASLPRFAAAVDGEWITVGI